MNKSAKFWDKIANKYSKQPITDQESYEKKIKKTQQYLKPHVNMLELGCGTGSVAIIHAPNVKHIHAVDISANMLEIAKVKTEKENIKNITFEQSTIDNLDIENESFEIVMALNLLHLLEDKDKAINKIHKILKSEGIFITNTACIGSWIKIIAPIGQLFGFMPLVKSFTTKDLENSIIKAGFDIEYRWQPENKNSAIFIIAKKI